MAPANSKFHAMAFFYMASGVLCFSILDAVTKVLTDRYGTWQIVLLSRLCPLIASLSIMRSANGGQLNFRTYYVKDHFYRALMILATTWAFYECVRYLQLTDAIAIGFAAPLFMTSLSGPLLGEHVSFRRWVAVSIGFLGVLIALRPGQHGISWGALLALSAALTYALGQLKLRPLSNKEHSHNIIFYSTFFSCLMALIPAAFDWRTPSFADWSLFVLQGICGAAAQIFMIRAFKTGEASMLAPLEYTALLWVAILGYVIWGHLPTTQIVVGAAIIIGSSLYISHLEIRAGARRIQN